VIIVLYKSMTNTMKSNKRQFEAKRIYLNREKKRNNKKPKRTRNI